MDDLVHDTFERLTRPRVDALDDILGVPFKVLNDGFVRVVDYMGADESIVQSARVSYGRGTKVWSEDRALIRYLMRHRHTTPFEMCEIKLHVRVPMDCWRQWIRHRTANVNEYSTRYSIAIDSAQRTSPESWRKQSSTGKQGSEGVLNVQTGEELSKRESQLLAFSKQIYEDRLKMGVAREQARKDLPLSTYTEAYWKIDLRNLMHFLHLRLDEHAQEEIRTYANVIAQEIVARWCPLAWDAFVDYQMNSVTLSRIELEIISAVALGDDVSALDVAGSAGWLSGYPSALKRNREREECESKLIALKLRIPWQPS